MTFDAKATPDQRLAAVAGLVKALNADRHPICLGPFRSELGFEASYWQPFLAGLAKQVKGFDQRAVVVTRGGLAPLYATLASQGYDLYALRSVTEVRRENLKQMRRTGQQKQILVTEWDTAVNRDAMAALGLVQPYHTVHPAWMYWALAPYWEEHAGLHYLLKLTDYAPLKKLPLPPDVTLPPRYVAVKFYARATWPYPHPDVSEFVQRVVATVAAQVPVLRLTSGEVYDDHSDIVVVGTNIASVGELAPPEQNLLVQAIALANAVAFIGTYGGMAQLAVRMRVPSLSLYHTWGGTSFAHYALNDWLGKMTKTPFTVGDLGEASLWQQIQSVPAGEKAADGVSV